MSRSSWDLVIATRQREQILPRCLRLAAAQTRPPAQMIVVDASPDWQAVRDRVLAELRPLHPQIRWQWVAADRASLPAQRNQGIRLATADVLFLFDDDTLMFPDAAEKIMAVYDADAGRVVAGVTPELSATPPDQPAAAPSAGHEVGEITRPNHRGLAKLLRRAIDADHRFVPYDERFPFFPVPPELEKMRVGTRRHMQGARMTFRRSVIEKEKFDEILEGYAAGEDLDATYRASRHGPLITCFDARVCHLKIPGGRFSRFAITALLAMNLAVLHRLHSTDPARSRRLYRHVLRREWFIHLLKDFRDRRGSIPTARGTWFALRHLADAFDRSPEQLRQWYPEFQKQVIERDGKPL